MIPVFKKNDPLKVENYRPISLLCIFSKIFEKCVYKYLHNFVISNNLITPHQSGFTKGDSTVNQLLYLSDEIARALDDGKEIRSVFFDISKAFDRVWHGGLLHKIQNFGIKGKLFDWIKSYLSDRSQKVILNGKSSNIIKTNAGVPQGSILGPFFFLIFINDIVLEVNCNIKLFADDTSIYVIINNPLIGAEKLNENLSKVHAWSEKWLIKFKPSKTETLTISRKNDIYHPPLIMNNTTINEVNKHKHLGLILSKNGKWIDHTTEIIEKSSRKINILRSLKFKLQRKSLEKMYFSFIRPVMEYADIIWSNCPQYIKESLENINLQAGRIITGATKYCSNQSIYNETGWPTLEQRRNEHKLIQFYKIFNGLTPNYLSSLLPPQAIDQHRYPTRNVQNFTNIHSKTTFYHDSFLPSTIRLWNDLPLETRQCKSISEFKKKISTKSPVQPYYYSGTRLGQILHTRIRMKCSALNQHLFLCNLIDSPLCTCGKIESASHFLLYCPNYFSLRDKYITPLQILCNITCNVLLFGNENLTNDENKYIFIKVQRFILKTKRFSK